MNKMILLTLILVGNSCFAAAPAEANVKIADRLNTPTAWMMYVLQMSVKHDEGFRGGIGRTLQEDGLTCKIAFNPMEKDNLPLSGEISVANEQNEAISATLTAIVDEPLYQAKFKLNDEWTQVSSFASLNQCVGIRCRMILSKDDFRAVAALDKYAAQADQVAAENK
jgi:hypothetical protein